LNYHALKERHRAERDAFHPNLSLRVHRALSWLNRAEQQNDDPDGRFRLSEQETFRAFLAKLVELDGKGRIAELVWTEFPKIIRVPSRREMTALFAQL
jgi:hypothetical protein